LSVIADNQQRWERAEQRDYNNLQEFAQRGGRKQRKRSGPPLNYSKAAA